MRRRLFPFVLGPILAVGAVLLLVAGYGERAFADHTPGHPATQLVARSQFIDEVSAQFKLRLAGRKPQDVVHVRDASEVVVLKITFRPGDSIGWHTHPGPAIVAVEKGTLTITNASDCIARPYPAGKAFLDPGAPNVHRADNLGSEDVVVHVTFLGIPAGSPPTNLEPPGC